jgi:hypothetical protein
MGNSKRIMESPGFYNRIQGEISGPLDMGEILWTYKEAAMEDMARESPGSNYETPMKKKRSGWQAPWNRERSRRGGSGASVPAVRCGAAGEAPRGDGHLAVGHCVEPG